MIAAVLTVLAARQVCAATLTVRHTGSADHPVRGSRMWWTRSAPRRHRRRIVLDVASAAPDGSATEPAGSSASSWTSTCQPPSGAGPAVAMSPPRLMSTPLPVARWTRSAQRSAAIALAVAPRSSTTPGGTVTTRSSRVTIDHLAGMLIDAATAVGVSSVAMSRSYPRAIIAAPIVGSTSPSVWRAAVSAASSRSASSSLTSSRPPG